MLIFFFVKQKTAYEMRISDWSSDVCSSDLVVRQRSRYDPHLPPHPDLANSAQHPTRWREVGLNHVATTPPLQVPLGRLSPRIKTAHWSANQPTEGSIPALPVANHTAQPCIALLVRHHPLLQRIKPRSEEHTSELQSLMRISYAVFCLK